MPKPSIEFYNAAIDAVQAGKLPEALAAVENSLTEDPRDGETWQLYVLILNSLGRTEDARKATEKLQDIGLNEIDEILLKASEASTNLDARAAIEHYRSAIELDASRPEIHASLALALLQAGQADAALSSARTAVSLDPANASANYALGHLLRLEGKDQPALEALSKAVASDPYFMLALYEEGMLLASSGKLHRALGNFEKFLENHPDDESAQQAVKNIRQRLEGTF
ncbi:tetratricopeptide repeat protein [Luteolibacter algae]|uniref:Tetratricopeptide repeat protein n=1 Tax=Luteolibacter algae TaxID=454151 RepID=A0ABW5D758_9BACT